MEVPYISRDNHISPCQTPSLFDNRILKIPDGTL